ncbi:MAG TPA: hypothetical protein VMI30_10790 [Stellaceae bacterium]|nr:hypothetical protein [Stellaceae bacterium]
MIVDWIYNHPTWLWGSILVIGVTGLACLGLTIFHRLVHVEVRRAHNDLAGFSIAIISVVYAVLLAFIAVATWEAFADAERIVQEEAGYIGNLYRDTDGFPEAVGAPMRATLRQYTNTVIDEEWPTQEKGEIPTAGWASLHKLHRLLVAFRPATMGEQVIEAEFLRTLNDLYKARETRLTAAAGHVPPVIWWIIFISGALTTGFTYLFGFSSFRMHLAMTGAVAASLALVVVLIVALDWPFRGEVSVSSDAYHDVKHSWHHDVEQ